MVIDSHLARGAPHGGFTLHDREPSNGGITSHDRGGAYGRTKGAERVVAVDVDPSV